MSKGNQKPQQQDPVNALNGQVENGEAEVSAVDGRTFEYVGDHESIDFYGIKFKRGEPVTVPCETIAYTWKKFGHGQNSSNFTEIPVTVVDKLAGHSDFVEVTE